jgi:hypothetical protein
MGVLVEAQNYQDYMIPHTWATENGEEPEQQQVATDIPGHYIEPTKPSAMDIVKALPWEKLAVLGLAVVGLVMIFKGKTPPSTNGE